MTIIVDSYATARAQDKLKLDKINKKTETLKFEVQDILSERITGHPSRKDQQRIDRLEKLVIMLADRIDKLNEKKQDRPLTLK